MATHWKQKSEIFYSFFPPFWLLKPPPPQINSSLSFWILNFPFWQKKLASEKNWPPEVLTPMNSNVPLRNTPLWTLLNRNKPLLMPQTLRKEWATTNNNSAQIGVFKVTEILLTQIRSPRDRTCIWGPESQCSFFQICYVAEVAIRGFFVLSIFSRWTKSGDQPQEYLAKSVYKTNRKSPKLKKTKISPF